MSQQQQELTKDEEKQFFLQHGICPYGMECQDSNGCYGTKEDMEICRQVKFKPIKFEFREKVQFD